MEANRTARPAKSAAAATAPTVLAVVNSIIVEPLNPRMCWGTMPGLFESSLSNVFAETIRLKGRYSAEIGRYPKIRAIDNPSIIPTLMRFLGAFSFQRTCLRTGDYKGMA